MEPRERLAYYKALIQQGIALDGTQNSDFVALVAEFGGASVEAMPRSSTRYELARQLLG